MVVGSDSPRVALYDDGSVIYLSPDITFRILASAEQGAEVLLKGHRKGMTLLLRYDEATFGCPKVRSYRSTLEAVGERRVSVTLHARPHTDNARSLRPNADQVSARRSSRHSCVPTVTPPGVSTVRGRTEKSTPSMGR